MAKTKKGKAKVVAIFAKDVVFKTLIHVENATIVAEQGMVMLYGEESKKVYRVPSGIMLPAGMYGSTLEIIVRNITEEVVLERGEDDVFEEELSLKGSEKFMPVDNWNDILTLMDERKIQVLTKAFTAVGTAVAGVSLAGVCAYLYTAGFKFPFVGVAGFAVGCVVAAHAVYNAFTKFKQADTKVIADGEGNYVNLDTGMTNMNGGMQLPI